MQTALVGPILRKTGLHHRPTPHLRLLTLCLSLSLENRGKAVYWKALKMTLASPLDQSYDLPSAWPQSKTQKYLALVRLRQTAPTTPPLTTYLYLRCLCRHQLGASIPLQLHLLLLLGKFLLFSTHRHKGIMFVLRTPKQCIKQS